MTSLNSFIKDSRDCIYPSGALSSLLCSYAACHCALMYINSLPVACGSGNITTRDEMISLIFSAMSTSHTRLFLGLCQFAALSAI